MSNGLITPEYLKELRDGQEIISIEKRILTRNSEGFRDLVIGSYTNLEKLNKVLKVFELRGFQIGNVKGLNDGTFFVTIRW